MFSHEVGMLPQPIDRRIEDAANIHRYRDMFQNRGFVPLKTITYKLVNE